MWDAARAARNAPGITEVEKRLVITSAFRAERGLRLIVGIMMLGLHGALPEPWRYRTLVGLVPFGTALTGFCPIRATLTRGQV